MSRFRSVWIRVRGLFALGMGLAAITLAFYLYIHEQPTPTSVIRMTAGSSQSMRHQFALALADEAKSQGLQVGVRNTTGSEESLDQVNAGAIDVALVQGGLDYSKRPNVRQIAALNVEPLHLLVRPELQTEVEGSLSSLRGKTVNLGGLRSGTNELAREVLSFAGLSKPDVDFKMTTLAYQDLVLIQDLDDLPDAVFLVSAPPAPIAQHLITKWNFRLVPLPFAEAFTLRATRGLGAEGPIDHTRVYPTTIPAYSYGIEPAVPDRTLSTFGTRLLMVGHKDVESSIIERLLTTTFSGRFAHLPHPPLDVSLLKLTPELEPHDGMREFLKRNEPLIAGDVIDFLEKTASLAGTIVAALFFLGHWFRQNIRRKRDLGFEAYIKKVSDVERRVLASELSATMDLKTLLGLQAELAAIKGDALDKFAEGEIDGEELLSGFLTHVNDARNYLARMILHERENLEVRAKDEFKSPAALWREEVDENE